MARHKQLFINIILVLIALILLGELIRDSLKAGDFVGYVQAGNNVLAGEPIYEDPLNTWPPFFSVFSVPLALGDQVSSFGIRFLWLLGSLLAMGYLIRETIRFSFHETVSLPGNPGTIRIQDPIVLIPLLIMLRFIMENLANVQINIYMLLCATLSMYFFMRQQHAWSGLLLALSISLKVYTIFFLLYFMFKREVKPTAWTFFFLVVINALPILVFGMDQSMAYYQQWYSEVAPVSFISHHQNQSVLGLFLRFFSAEDPGHNLYVNFVSLPADTVRRISQVVIVLAALVPAFLLRKKLTDTRSIRSILEYAVVFTLVPLLSPLAWKPYFIFLWLPYLLAYTLLFRVPTDLRPVAILRLKVLFWLSVILTVFSTESIVGNHFSNVMEAWSALTIGTTFLLIILLTLIYYEKRFDMTRLAKEDLTTAQ